MADRSLIGQRGLYRIVGGPRRHAAVLLVTGAGVPPYHSPRGAEMASDRRRRGGHGGAWIVGATPRVPGSARSPR